MDCWHLTLAGAQRQHLFPDATTRLAAVRTLVRIAGSQLLLWCVVDDHVHVVASGDRRCVGRLAQRLQLALGGVAVGVFGTTHFQEVAHRRHLVRLVGYVLTQTEHHGLGQPAAGWQGSCLADLIGARRLRGFDPGALAAHLPRMSPSQVLAEVGLAERDLVEPDLAGVGLNDLLAAAARAVGRPALVGRSPEVLEGKHAVVSLALRVGWQPRHLAPLLQVHVRSVQRLAHHPADPRVAAAIRRQLALSEAVRRRAPAATARSARG